MKLDSRVLLEALRKADPVWHYNDCVDIALAGEDYKVQRTETFAACADDPAAGFVLLKHYYDGFVRVLAETGSEALLEEAFFALFADAGSGEIRFSTSRKEQAKSLAVVSRFEVSSWDEPVNPVYFLREIHDLIPHPAGARQRISRFGGAERAWFEEQIGRGRSFPEELWPAVAHTYEIYRDTKTYVLWEDGEPVGWLRAECGFENIYDIGWLYILPEKRGKGLAPVLVCAFAEECWHSDCIPCYGYAINEASVRVAQKCGFRTGADRLTHYRLCRRA